MQISVDGTNALIGVNSLENVISRASLVPKSSYIAKPAASWLDDFLVWISPEAFSCCRKFTNDSYCPPGDQPPCCFPDEGPSDCAKGGHGAYTNSVDLNGYKGGVIQASGFVHPSLFQPLDRSIPGFPFLQVDKDPFPPIGSSGFMRHGDKLGKKKHVPMKPFSSVLLPNENFPSLSEDGNGRRAVFGYDSDGKSRGTTAQKDVNLASKKLKEQHPWAENSLIGDILAAVNNNVDKAVALLETMVSADDFEECKVSSYPHPMPTISKTGESHTLEMVNDDILFNSSIGGRLQDNDKDSENGSASSSLHYSLYRHHRLNFQFNSWGSCDPSLHVFHIDASFDPSNGPENWPIQQQPKQQPQEDANVHSNGNVEDNGNQVPAASGGEPMETDKPENPGSA
ncbi:hypothetical protein KIW84_035595 [Lathyrus oleraceus]|uniref:Uncharacterized protein n=1 Tax=Pisum sativum TaxID=3888 RepID=A0A9D4Y412_PEA|nr:hypothetical protein KIW84_035595 [Pisum sativum]